MLSVGSWGEILIIAVAALILIGPREIPGVLQTCSRWIFRIRSMAIRLRNELDALLQQAELHEFDKRARRKAGEKGTSPIKEIKRSPEQNGLFGEDDTHPC